MMRNLIMLAIVVLMSMPVVSQSLYKGSDNVQTPAYSPELPETMRFADTDISFDRIDMYERMDREMISLIYSHTNTMLTIKRANRYYQEIVSILKEQGIPEDFFYLAAIESCFDNRAVSSARASGIWQFMPATARQFGLEVNDYVDERYNCEKATVAACKYLKQGYRKYGCWMTVASSYNAGMGRIGTELKKQGVETAFDLYLNQETSRYIFRMLAIKTIMEDPEKYGFYIKPEQLYYPVDYKEKKVDYPVENWADWAQNEGISYAQLREMNPWIRNIKLPNKSKKAYTVRIPVKKDLYRSTQTKQIYNRNWIIK